MKLQPWKLATAVAAAFGISWTICSLLVLVLPGPIMTITGYMMHANFSALEWKIDGRGFLLGLIAWMAISGGIAGLAAVIYNKNIGDSARPS
jgi:hypothetical protein